MKIDEEQDMIIKLDKRINDSIDIIYKNIDNVETNILDLFKVCGCVFNKEMFYSLVLDFNLFDKQSGNFEKIASQISSPVTVAEAIMIDTIMKKLSDLMDRLVEYIKQCNAMIENNNFDIRKAQLLEKLDNNYAYDTVIYEDLCEAVLHPYLVVKTSDIIDEDYPKNYFPLHVLGLVSFDSKLEAYKYCLANGISRDNVLLRW